MLQPFSKALDNQVACRDRRLSCLPGIGFRYRYCREHLLARFGYFRFRAGDFVERQLRDIRAGKTRADSLEAMAQRLNEPGLTQLCQAVLQAERLGMALGPILRAQADQRRQERFLRAEKLAMQAPVKMLFPLIAFIFPATFIVLFFPIAIRFMQSGF